MDHIGPPRHRLLPLGVAFALALSGAGCYTLLQHPRDDQLPGDELSGSCLGCHEADPGYNVTGLPWVDYYSASSYPWINYYGSPWWYDATWAPAFYGERDQVDERQAAPQRTLGLWGWQQRPSFFDRNDRSGSGDRPPFAAPVVAAPRLPAMAPRPVAQPAAVQSQAGGEEEESPEQKSEKKKDKPKQRVLRR